jgi:drug/metabolite transporter (DMT)-like permease
MKVDAANTVAAGGAAKRRVMAWACMFAMTWALLEIVVAVVLGSRYHVMQIVWCRYAAHLAAVMLIWGLRRPKLWRTRRPLTQITRSLMMLAMPAAFALAIREGVSLDFMQSLFWTAPMQIVLIAWIFLDERPPLTVWAAAVIGTAGSAAIFGHLQTGSLFGVVLGLVGSLSFSAYVVMTRSLRSEPAPTNLLYTGLAVFIVLTPFMPHVWAWPTPADCAVLALIGITGVFALYALERACETGAVWVTAIMLFAQAVCVGLFFTAGGAAPSPHAGLGIATVAAVIGAFWIFAGSLEPRATRVGGE